MRLHTVTISGVDYKTEIPRLEGLSKAFPFVEWGLLHSSVKTSKPRNQFASAEWIQKAFESDVLRCRMAIHICGESARQVLAGVLPTEQDLARFRRIQLNVGSFFNEESQIDGAALAKQLPTMHQYIVQVGENRQRGILLAEQLRTA